MLRGMGSASNSDLSPQPLAQVMVSKCQGLFLLQPMRQQRSHCHYSEQDFSLQCPAWLPPGRAERGGLASEGFLTRGFLHLLQGGGGRGSQREGKAWAARSMLRLREKPVQQSPQGLQLSWAGGWRREECGEHGEGRKIFIYAQLCRLPVLVTLQNLNYRFWENVPLKLEQSFK